MLIYLKKYGDLVTIFHERAPTAAEKKRDRGIKRIREAVTVRFQKAGREPIIDVKKTEQR